MTTRRSDVGRSERPYGCCLSASHPTPHAALLGAGYALRHPVWTPTSGELTAGCRIARWVPPVRAVLGLLSRRPLSAFTDSPLNTDLRSHNVVIDTPSPPTPLAPR